jgi:thiosulfate/3-mercaptopyruvate sulfurtransferase
MGQQYAHPEVLVSTEWLADHLQDSNLRVVESDEDVLLYETGHIPGAVKIDWHEDEQDPIRRDFVDRAGFERLAAKRGIGNDTTVVFYGDRNNWYATYTFWLFRLFGHQNLKILDGGRAKWQAEGRPFTKEVPAVPAASYTARDADPSIRAFRDEVLRDFVRAPGNRRLVDVRGPAEYTGQVIAMVDYPQEGAQRGGHIPGAKNIPWAKAANADGTFKSAEELSALYAAEGVRPDNEVVAYCRIGERSSHTWFVLTQLLGFEKVKNYDGSWTEWGSMVGVPIER